MKLTIRHETELPKPISDVILICKTFDSIVEIITKQKSNSYLVANDQYKLIIEAEVDL